MKAFPKRIWHQSRSEKSIYLTFDDGPIPGLSPWILELLKAYEAKGTFFMVGENVARYPDLAQQVLAEGHSIGNHTHRHLHAGKHSLQAYIHDVAEGQHALRTHLGTDTSLFRPPYGRLPMSFAKQLEHYQVIMWDVLSGDFDQKLRAEDCLKSSIRATSPGSIIVWHDNVKSEARIREALPAYLEHFSRLGYKFKAL
jgi:peptidoglycan/xylan/chitin deacetylase (PgdA/CDA1 family)